MLRSRARAPEHADHPDVTPPQTTGSGRLRFGLFLTFFFVAVGLAVFLVWSSLSDVAARGMDGDGAPIYGDLAPTFAARGWLAVAALIAAGATAWWTLRRELASWKHVTAATLVAFGFAASLALVRYDAGGLSGTTFREKPPSYHADVPLVRELGVRRVVRDYPDVVPRLVSHMKTHPPAALIGMDLLERASPSSTVPRGLVVGLLGSLLVIPVWFIARRVAGDRAARMATLLVALAPGPAIFAFTSLDAVFATVLVAVTAGLVGALAGPKGRGLMITAGVALALASFVTYAVAFVALFAVIFAFANHRPAEAFRRLVTIGAGAVAGAALLVFVIGFDLIGSYRAFQDWLGPTPFQLRRSHAFWLGGNWGVWLLYAGLPIAALMIRELWSKRPRYLIAFFVPLVVFYVLPFSVTSLLPGENQRTLLFAYAIAAVAAGANLARWEADRKTWKPHAVTAILVIAGIQALAMRAMYLNFY